MSYKIPLEGGMLEERMIELVKNHLEISEISLKFPLGPIISPSPGPTFDIEVAAPETADKKSRPVKDRSIAKSINNNKYENIKTITEVIKSSDIF